MNEDNSCCETKEETWVEADTIPKPLVEQYTLKPIKVIKFEGGAENATPIINWCLENGMTASWCPEHPAWQSPKGTEKYNAEQEHIRITMPNRGRRELYPGACIVVWNSGSIDIVNASMFNPEGDYMKFEPAPEAEELTPTVEKFEVDGLFSFDGVLHGRRADNGNFVPIVVLDGKPTQLEKQDVEPRRRSKVLADVLATVQSAGLGQSTIDAIASALNEDGVASEDFIYQLTKYNEHTATKAEAAMLRFGFSNMNIQSALHAIELAGLIIRERA